MLIDSPRLTSRDRAHWQNQEHYDDVLSHDPRLDILQGDGIPGDPHPEEQRHVTEYVTGAVDLENDAPPLGVARKLDRTAADDVDPGRRVPDLENGRAGCVVLLFEQSGERPNFLGTQWCQVAGYFEESQARSGGPGSTMSNQTVARYV